MISVVAAIHASVTMVRAMMVAMATPVARFRGGRTGLGSDSSSLIGRSFFDAYKRGASRDFGQ